MTAATLPVVAQWWARRRHDDGIDWLWEPEVADVLRCNVWHIKGRDRDLVLDTGLGLAPLLPDLEITPGHEPLVVLTHTHADHVGGWHEFDDRWLHRAEADLVDPATAAPDLSSLWTGDIDEDERAHMTAAGYHLPDCLITAIPDRAFSPDVLAHRPAPATRLLTEGDIVDLGDRAFEVLHLPGHSPGSIGLYDAAARLLLSGDAVYDGPLLDELPGSDIGDYLATMSRLADLDVDQVLPGHGPAFGPDRLDEITRDYRQRREGTA